MLFLRLSSASAPIRSRFTLGFWFRVRNVRSAAAEPAPRVLPVNGASVSWRVHRAVRLRVFGGRVWITRDGCPDDHWLEPGQTLDLPVPTGWFGWRIHASGEGASLVTLKEETPA